MKQLKSFFISIYVTLLWGALIHSTMLLYQGENIGLWLGVVLSVGPMAFFFLRLFVANVVRTSAKLKRFLAVTYAGAALTVFAGASQWDTLAMVYSLVVGVLGGWLYVYWYSIFNREPNSLLSEGAQLPVFELKDCKGEVVSSAEYAGSPALFIFYRGNWCPLCMAQIKEVSAQYKELDRRGVKVVLISPQPHEYTQSLANRFDVPFSFMVDEGNRAAKALGIDAENGLPKGLEALRYESDTVMPTVIISDASGKIIFADLTDNYRLRPEPEVFLSVLEAAGYR